MNIYRVLGDACLVLGTPVIAWKAHTQGPTEISLSTHFLRALMFTTRYLDLFTTFLNPYNTLVKCCLLANSIFFAFYLAFQKHSQPGSKRIAPALGSTVVIIFSSLFTATWFNYQFNLMEILWSFSKILSICAEIPQLMMVYRMPKCEFWLEMYYSTLLCYIVFYGFNWGYRYIYEGMVDPIAIACAVGQVVVISGFLITSRLRTVNAAPEGDLESERDYPEDKKIPIIIVTEVA